MSEKRMGTYSSWPAASSCPYMVHPALFLAEGSRRRRWSGSGAGWTGWDRVGRTVAAGPHRTDGGRGRELGAGWQAAVRQGRKGTGGAVSKDGRRLWKVGWSAAAAEPVG